MRGARACVAADHPLAVSAGLAVMAEGATAADAAVAMGAVMTVVQPQYSHLGGDLFALNYDAPTGQVRGLNSSGPAPAALDVEEYRALGAIPQHGPLAVTVPGWVDGWWKLHQEAGRLPWKRLLEPAIGLAREGFPASRGLARAIPEGRAKVYPADFFKRTFGAVGAEGGQGVVQPELARTLDTIAAGGAEPFYTGEIRAACLSALNGRGGCFAVQDWKPPGTWAEPVSTAFAGHLVHTQPPVSQGFALLLALRRYQQLLGDRAAAESVSQYRAVARAFALRHRHAGDPAFTGFDAARLLAGDTSEAAPVGALPTDGDTTYLLAIDAEGNAVSLIQSLFAPWGSGVAVPELGIFMNNRLWGFDLRPGSPNELAPGKRPIHTLHSYLVTEEMPGPTQFQVSAGARPVPPALRLVGGTPGAHRQVSTNLQVLDHVLRRGSDVQDALDAPRWALGPDGTVEVETREPDHLGDEFRAAGVDVTSFDGWDGRMGRAYVARTRPGMVEAAGDLRGEGGVAVL